MQGAKEEKRRREECVCEREREGGLGKAEEEKQRHAELSSMTNRQMRTCVAGPSMRMVAICFSRATCASSTHHRRVWMGVFRLASMIMARGRGSAPSTRSKGEPSVWLSTAEMSRFCGLERQQM